MRFVSSLFLHGLIAAVVFVAVPVSAQQAPETFRWIDFHSAKDQDVVVWVTRSLVPEKWSAVREIGVQYDAALVVTTLRATPQSDPASDTFTVWNLSLTSHVVAPLLKGVNLRFIDWMLLSDGRPRELGALYDDCHECAASTFITAFYYDIPHHMWASRWMRGTQSAPVWTAKPPSGVAFSQLYAVLAEPNGRQLIGTWGHFDYGTEKDPDDSVYRYDLDPNSGLERTQLLVGKEADSMKQRLCAAQSESPGLARGQDSPLCLQAVKQRIERKPTTKPPANNHGLSQPPGARH